jgi:hypothetical protein
VPVDEPVEEEPEPVDEEPILSLEEELEEDEPEPIDDDEPLPAFELAADALRTEVAINVPPLSW